MVTGARRGPGDAPPRAMGTGWRGIALSLLVHGFLLLALMWGIRWQSVGTEVVTAELWSEVPQAAPEAAPQLAPPPPPPPPPPAESRTPATLRAEADIALEKARREKAEQERREQAERERLEQERRQKAERERLEQERREKVERERLEKERREKAEREERQKRELAQKEARERAQAEAREKAAAERREARQREENLERMMGQLGAAGGSSTRAGSAGASGTPSASYAGRIVAAIKPNIVFADSLPGNPAAEVEVRAGPGGTIIGRTLVKSSGHPEWDEAVLRAIDRTGTLPRDTDGRVPSRLTILFRPRD